VVLSRQEFEALARLKEPLVQVRGRWVQLQPDQVQRVLAFMETQASRDLSLQEAARMAIAPEAAAGVPVLEVAADGWLEEVLRTLCEPTARERQQLDEPPGFVGQLRPYQRMGVAWLETLRRYGLGACLADDMGLARRFSSSPFCSTPGARAPARHRRCWSALPPWSATGGES